ncbi:hypothetical protein JCM10213_009036 [Rhodosporidiobolus nylandii]
MAISAPLPSTALSSHTLSLSLTLDALPAPPPLNVDDDPFDALDAAAYDWKMEADHGSEAVGSAEDDEQAREGATASSAKSTLSSALSDSTSVLFPGINLTEEALLASCQAGAAGGAEGGLSGWLKETSGRVTALASGQVRLPNSRGAEQQYGGALGGSGKRRRSEVRVAAGCEDGTVWVFAPPPAPVHPEGPQTGRGANLILEEASDGVGSSRRLSRDSAYSPTSTSSSHPTSPPTSPSPRSRRNFSSASASAPRLLSRRSSSSISTLASAATTRTHRVSSSTSSSAAPASVASGLSYDVLRSVSRPRKASATVSVSTSSAVPSHSTSSHSAAEDLPDLPPLPKSPLPTSPRTAASPPLSPTTIPHFVFSSPSPSPAPSQNALGSRKEGARTPGGGGPASAPMQKRSHSRAKDSIASGIGLWETDAAASSRSSLASPGLAEEGRVEEEGESQQPEQGEVTEKLEELRPVLRISTLGWGEVVGLEVLCGMASCDLEEGAALVVLRSSGHLSVVSLVDGHKLPLFGMSPISHRSSFLSYSDGSQTPVALCSAGGNVMIPVRLDTLVPQEPLDLEVGSVKPAIPSSSPPLSPQPKTRLHSSFVLFGGLAKPLQLLKPCGERLIASDGSSLSLFALRDHEVVIVGQLSAPSPASSIVNICADVLGETLAVLDRHKLRTYRLEKRHGEGEAVDFRLISQQTVEDVEQVAFLPSISPCSSVLLARFSAGGARTLDDVPVLPSSEDVTRPKTLYRSSATSKPNRVTCAKPLGNGRVLLGYNGGGIAVIDLADLGRASPPPVEAELRGGITLLEVLELGGRQIVVAGSASGMAGAWSLSDWDLIGSWTLFASPVKHYAYIDPSPTPSSKLGNTVAFISANSPVALVSLFPPQLLFVLPGTKSAVELIATTQDEILVLYEQGLARSCDIASKELRRSMDRRTAERSFAEGGWTTWFRLEDARRAARPAFSPADPLLHLELRTFLEEAAQQLPWTAARSTKKRDVLGTGTPEDSPNPSKSGSVTPPQTAKDLRRSARQLIAALATFGVDTAIDKLLEQVEIVPPADVFSSVISSDKSLSTSSSTSGKKAWQVSPVATAQRLLLIVCLLRIFLNYPETERIASEAIVYYASCLADSVGSSFAPPSLDVFARFWLDRNGEIQQSSKSLFGTYLAAMQDDDILAFVERWQEKLPSRQDATGVLHHQSDHALLVVGLVAIERFKLLSSTILKDLSVSVAAYLEDHEHPYHQAVATELCSRGFGIWQNYVDAMSLVRQLFGVAIGRNPSTPNDLRLLARHATMHVAVVNTPLFMSTLVHDILNAPTAPARNATLKLLGFIIRKKPLVLYTSLPRVAEAVVKSLDPTVSSLRETVHQAATVILNELVRTFPSIDFHGKSQRLAVGTHEGAAIVFDLRTATRLYVLEGHARPVTALSFSPDGHRLVTLSLEESRIAAWRVSTGLFSMFSPGAPPRQSGGNTAPLKTYDFHVGDEALMTTAATLEWVVFDWPAERTVRLRLRETALNFGV